MGVKKLRSSEVMKYKEMKKSKSSQTVRFTALNH